MKILFLISIVLTIACSALARPKKDQPTVNLYPSETLHVQVIDNVWRGRDGIGLNDRFRRIKAALEEVLEETDFPLECQVERFGANRTPPSVPRLDITIMEWGDNRMSEVEVRFGASLRRDYDRENLGVIFERGMTAFGSSDQLIRAHDKVMRDALRKLVAQLQERLVYQSLEEEEISVERGGVEVPIGEEE